MGRGPDRSTGPAAGRSTGAPGRSQGRRLVVATRSRHKLGELRVLLHLPGVRLLDLDDAGIAEEAPEDGETFDENAVFKARFYARLSGLPTLADDSGLEVDALDGRPGVRTRRFAGPDATDDENNAHLLTLLSGLPPERRTARYRCALAFVDPDSERPERVTIRRGTFEGRIATHPRGRGGFGYDPVFEPLTEPPGGRTVGELTADEKNRVSHRAAAARAMRPVLRGRGFGTA
jgi:XTP/dITP diphosphohydrolase